MQQGSWLQTLLPFAIIAVVMIRRWKTMDRPVPLKTSRMWILPALLTALVGFMLYVMPPGPLGWGLFALGLMIGLAVGWQRARLMRIDFDRASGQVLVRQSPAAFLFILALIFLRRLLVPTRGAESATPHAGPPALPLVTDALFGFALGMVIGTQLEMWRRAKLARAEAEAA